MEKIGVEMVAQDAAFIASSKAAAAAVNQIAAAEAKLAVAAKELGVDGKKFSQEFARVEKQRVAQQTRAAKQTAQSEKQAVKAADVASRKSQADERKRVAADQRAQKQAVKAQETKAKKEAADTKKQEVAAKKLRDKQAETSKEQIAALLTIAGAAAGVAVAIGGAVVAAGYLTVKLATAALSAVELRENARGFFNVLTAGRGTKELENVDRLAGQLGVKFNDARQEFIQFRQTGLDNRQSAKLIKLAADLNTVDHSGELARQAIQRVLSYTSPNGIQTPEQIVAADKAMALLARQARVSGKGIEAAHEATTTLVGALNRIDNVKTKNLETLGERIKPSIDRAASSVADLFERFASSENGKQSIEAVGKAITTTADAFNAAVPRIEKAWAIGKRVLDDPAANKALENLGIVAKAAGAGISGFADGVFSLVAPLAAMKSVAGDAVVGLGKLMVKAIELVPAMYNAGKNIVAGLAKGVVEATPGAVGAVVDLAARMTKGFREKLDMHSPSRVFEGYGVNIGAGTRKGIVASMPTGAELAAMVKPPVVANDNWRPAPTQRRAQQVAPASNGNDARASGGHNMAPFFDGGRLDINVVIEHGTPPADTETQVIAILENWWARKMAQRGAA